MRRRTGFALAAVALSATIGGCEVVVSDGGTKGSGETAPPPSTCAMCGEDDCVDLTSDPNSCGACARSCGGEPCVDGVCGGSMGCAADELLCDGVCVDARSAEACGGCDLRCEDGEVCVDVADAPATCLARDDCEASGGTACGERCVDTQSDPAHCGACFETCDGRCDGGACEGGPPPPGGMAYAFRPIAEDTVELSSDESCDGSEDVEDDLSAVNTPLRSAAGDRVTSMQLRYRMGTFIGEPTRAATFAWEGVGSLGSVRWVTEVLAPDGRQYTVRGERIYAGWTGGTIGEPGEGFGFDSTGSPSWSSTFLLHVGGNEFEEGVASDDAQQIFRACFRLGHFQVLDLDGEAALEDSR